MSDARILDSATPLRDDVSRDATTAAPVDSHACVDRQSRRRLLATAFFALTLTGGHCAMSATPEPTPRKTTWPLRFKVHDFAVHCYNTRDCKVIYNHHNFTLLTENKPSPPPRSANYKDDWGLASYIGVRNFPQPAQITWISLDGAAHEAAVDIGAIFKDERVLHKVPEAEIPDGAFVGPACEPNIYLEVNDRTISVYMMMMVPTKTEQIPGNKYSDSVDDLIFGLESYVLNSGSLRI